ncbi:hypothetical protein LAUMK4_05659 [Mycobacterium persicum]|jgi:hypothetical protein|uniref:Uncharacterized protein n=1 Tax=Mycobacterium persicum TaxID=1487726 RepID=A0ABY6RS10_9MYCO|nr:Uncharacterised protein [Mycobacteroides abscessus subsp. abscessus]VBA32012.1 hypothetical protein LAUMK4_05659 [Mycobacterium persicum]
MLRVSATGNSIGSAGVWMGRVGTGTAVRRVGDSRSQ